jgi:vesicular inhibitory amino acid transporter
MLLRTPKLLSYLSMVGTISTIAVVLAVILSAVVEGDVTERVAAEQGIQNAKPYHTGWRTEGLILSFGLVAYCFSGHAIVPAIYSSMARPQDFEKMVTLTFAIVICCCFAVALSGYYMFGSVVHDQVTLSLEQSSDAVLAMKALTWMMILTGKSPQAIFSLLLFANALTIHYLSSFLQVFSHNVPTSVGNRRTHYPLSHESTNGRFCRLRCQAYVDTLGAHCRYLRAIF